MYRLLATAVFLVAAHGALACNVPVFRYALERWTPDNFSVVLYHRGPLSTNEQAVANALKEVSDKCTANFTLATVDLPGPTNVPLPYVVADYPGDKAMGVSAWKGPFTPDTGRLLVDSPARRELVRRLAKGDSIVWVLVDGDQSSVSLLDTELRKLEKEITLPEVDPNDPRTEGNTELKIAFSVLPVSRGNPAEELFVSMLTNTDPELRKETGPIAFPLFGRGRMLTGFAGRNLNAVNIGEATRYLCGACSCEIKEQNPGVDMLLAADWDAAVANPVVKDPPLPPLVGLSALAAAAQPPVRPVPPAVTNNLRRNTLFALGGLACVVALGAITMTIRRRP
jgi:hypothetical protein